MTRRKLFKHLVPMMEEYVETLMATAESAVTPVAEASSSALDQDVHFLLTLAVFDESRNQSDSAHTSIRKSECKYSGCLLLAH